MAARRSWRSVPPLSYLARAAQARVPPGVFVGSEYRAPADGEMRLCKRTVPSLLEGVGVPETGDISGEQIHKATQT